VFDSFQNNNVKRIQFAFNERKAAQAAARLIQHSGGEMNYLALMKLLYLVDREALIRLGRPVTGDTVVAMKHGPVLSRVYDLVSHKKQGFPASHWHQFIPRPGRYVYTVRFSGLTDPACLSEAETAVIDDVFAQYRDKDEWELVAFTHALPEWRDPGDSSAPIPYEDILHAAGASEDDIEAIADNAAADEYLDSVLATVRA
jgi:uncharacterized phage-associated protein